MDITHRYNNSCSKNLNLFLSFNTAAAQSTINNNYISTILHKLISPSCSVCKQRFHNDVIIKHLK